MFRTLRASACAHMCARRVLESGRARACRLKAGKRSGSRSWPALHRNFSPKCWPGKFWGNFTTRTALLLLITARSRHGAPLPHTHHRLRPGAGQRHCLCRQPSPGSAAPPHPRVSLTLAPPRPTLRAGPLGRSLLSLASCVAGEHADMQQGTAARRAGGRSCQRTEPACAAGVATFPPSFLAPAKGSCGRSARPARAAGARANDGGREHGRVDA